MDLHVDRAPAPVQVPLDVFLALFQRPKLFAHRPRIAVAAGDEVEAPLDASRNPGQFRPKTVFVACSRLAQPGDLLLELHGKSGDHRFVALQDVPQAVQDPILDLAHADAAVCIAGSLLAPRRAVITIALADRHAATAAAAPDESAQEAFLALAFVAPAGRVPPLEVLNTIPEGVVDDPKLWNLLDVPLVFRIGPGGALAGVRVLDEALAVIGDAPDVKLVVEDAVAALPAAVDGRCVPLTAPRARDRFPIEARGNQPRCATAGVLIEYPPDDRGLPGIDRAFARGYRSVVEEPADDPISIAVAAGDLAGLDPAALPAPRLLGEVLEEERVHRALEADMELADRAFRQGDNPDIGVRQALVDRGDVLLVAAHPIERFRDDEIEAALLRAVQQSLDAGPVPQRAAADGVVRENRADGAFLLDDPFAAEPDLVLDR